MSKRQKLKEELYPEENEEEEEEDRKLKSVTAASSDDEEANEDLSLKIVEKHLLMRAAKLDQDEDNFLDYDVVLNENENKNVSVVDITSSFLSETKHDVTGPSGVSDDTIIRDVKCDKKTSRVRKKKKDENNFFDDDNGLNENENENDRVVDLPSSSLPDTELDFAGPSGVSDGTVIRDVKSGKKKSRVRKKKKKVENVEIGDQSVIVAKVDQNAETVENDVEAVKPAEDPNSVEMSDNIVLRKLLRGPRYFDPPDSGWQMCYNCGEEGHMAVNCSSAVKRKRPCFICGSLEHGAKQCTKAQDCFICKKGGHRAKECPEKHKNGSWIAQICLKCGDPGHDLFSCRNGYSLDDLKEIQCYVCKSFGHLCCIKVCDMSSREVSCFRCGQLGHTGLACGRLRVETTDASPSSCYKCGGEGHFARECVSSVKVRKRNIELSTPTLKPHRENKGYLGHKSAPHDLGKAYKKKKTPHEERDITTPQKSKQRGGWIVDDPGDVSNGKAKRNHWRSPGTPSGKGHKISAVTSGGHISNSQPSKKKSSHQRFSAWRFDNSGSDGIRRNYEW